VAVSAPLRSLALDTASAALNEESGFVELEQLIATRTRGGAAAEAVAEVVAVCDHLAFPLEAERAVLCDPAAAQRLIEELSVASGETPADLTAELDRDLRARIGRVVQEADAAIDEGDPADSWAQMAPWLQSRVAHELIEHYALLWRRVDELSVDRPTASLSHSRLGEPAGPGTIRTMRALRRAYGGLTFTALGDLGGIGLEQIAVGIALVMGRQGLREEKERQQIERRVQAKNAVRRYCDEVGVMISADAREVLRSVEDQVRVHAGDRSQTLAHNAVLAAASLAPKDRTRRLAELDPALAYLGELRRRAEGRAG
jgi:hypothetical protein